MSLFSRIFGRRQSATERGLHEVYAQMLIVAGFSPQDADQSVSKAITMCKHQRVAEGTADLPENFGDRLIEAARMGHLKSQRIVDKARREGVTDEDVKEWLNLPDLSRRMVLWSENLFRYTVFLAAKEDEGLTSKDAAARVHKTFPMYGDPDDTSILSGENRPLPHELRGRVDSYNQVHGAEYIADQVKNFSSYNAFVRHAVEAGTI